MNHDSLVLTVKMVRGNERSDAKMLCGSHSHLGEAVLVHLLTFVIPTWIFTLTYFQQKYCPRLLCLKTITWYMKSQFGYDNIFPCNTREEKIYRRYCPWRLAHSPARRHRLGCLRLIASIGLRSRRDRCSLVVVCIMAVCGGSHRAQPLLTSHRRAERQCPRRLENPSREVTESTERGPNRCYSLTLLATRMYLPLSPGPVSKIPSSPAGVQAGARSPRLGPLAWLESCCHGCST